MVFDLLSGKNCCRRSLARELAGTTRVVTIRRDLDLLTPRGSCTSEVKELVRLELQPTCLLTHRLNHKLEHPTKS